MHVLAPGAPPPCRPNFPPSTSSNNNNNTTPITLATNLPLPEVSIVNTINMPSPQLPTYEAAVVQSSSSTNSPLIIGDSFQQENVEVQEQQQTNTNTTTTSASASTTDNNNINNSHHVLPPPQRSRSFSYHKPPPEPIIKPSFPFTVSMRYLPGSTTNLPSLISGRQAPLPDDSDVQTHLPTICVDYLSHDWDEGDVWTSWKAMTKRKSDVATDIRLENASWRNWAKRRGNLKTVSPQQLNWLKDSDVTWLYGPLHTAKDIMSSSSESLTRSARSPQFRNNNNNNNNINSKPANHKSKSLSPDPPRTKPILKHRSFTDVLFLPTLQMNDSDDTGSDDQFPISSHSTTTKAATNASTTTNYNENENGSEALLDPKGTTALQRASPVFEHPSNHHNRHHSNPILQSSSSDSRIHDNNAHLDHHHDPSSSYDLNDSSKSQHSSRRRHISFNQHVEQCIALDSYESSPLPRYEHLPEDEYFRPTAESIAEEDDEYDDEDEDEEDEEEDEDEDEDEDDINNSYGHVQQQQQQQDAKQGVHQIPLPAAKQASLLHQDLDSNSSDEEVLTFRTRKYRKQPSLKCRNSHENINPVNYNNNNNVNSNNNNNKLSSHHQVQRDQPLPRPSSPLPSMVSATENSNSNESTSSTTTNTTPSSTANNNNQQSHSRQANSSNTTRLHLTIAKLAPTTLKSSENTTPTPSFKAASSQYNYSYFQPSYDYDYASSSPSPSSNYHSQWDCHVAEVVDGDADDQDQFTPIPGYDYIYDPQSGDISLDEISTATTFSPNNHPQQLHYRQEESSPPPHHHQSHSIPITSPPRRHYSSNIAYTDNHDQQNSDHLNQSTPPINISPRKTCRSILRNAGGSTASRHNSSSTSSSTSSSRAVAADDDDDDDNDTYDNGYDYDANGTQHTIDSNHNNGVSSHNGNGSDDDDDNCRGRSASRGTPAYQDRVVPVDSRPSLFQYSSRSSPYSNYNRRI